MTEYTDNYRGLELFDWAERQRSSRPEIRNENGKRATILERLAAGPLSTFDAERIVHRGQAVIHSLICEGHKIIRQPIDGVDHYVYVGRTKRVQVPKSLQEVYYASSEWKRVAAERKHRDDFSCRQCGATEDLETHHWRYPLFCENVQYDLITFCAACHQAIHEAIAGSRVHFPRFVTEELARRIEAK